MDQKEILGEVARLRRLDEKRRVISEEAESTVRHLRVNIQIVRRELIHAHNKLAEDVENKASEATITADLALCERILNKLAFL